MLNYSNRFNRSHLFNLETLPSYQHFYLYFQKSHALESCLILRKRSRLRLMLQIMLCPWLLSIGQFWIGLTCRQMVRVNSIIFRGRPPGSSSGALQTELPCLQPGRHRHPSRRPLVNRRIASSWIWTYPRWWHVLGYPPAAFATFCSRFQLLSAFPL